MVDSAYCDNQAIGTEGEQRQHFQAIKFSMNHPSKRSVLIHPLELRPYLVPGTSSLVQAGFNLTASYMTIGGIACPVALAQATIVI